MKLYKLISKGYMHEARYICMSRWEVVELGDH